MEVLTAKLTNRTELRWQEDLRATQDEKYDFVIGVASGQSQFPEIVTRIKNKLYTRNAG